MGLLRKILGQFYVMIVRLQKDEKPEQELYCVGKRGIIKLDGVSKIRKISDYRHFAVIVAFSGYGVIRKEYEGNPEMISRIKQGNDFQWEIEMQSEGISRICFVRKEIVASYVKCLREQEVSVVGIRLVHEPDAIVIGRISAQFYEEIGSWKYWRNLDEGSNRLALLITHKVMWALLIGNLLLAAVNFPLQNLIERKSACQKQELADLRKIESEQKSETEMTERIVREFGTGKRIIFLADRLAASIPEGVVLDVLAVNPLKRSPEELKPLVRQEKYVELEGHAQENDQIIFWAGDLAVRFPGWQVRLIRLDQQKEKGIYVFKIGIEL